MRRPHARHAAAAVAALALPLAAGCALFEEAPVPPPADAPLVAAYGESAAVASDEDAADDPAIWVNPANPAASRIMGTDKQSGLYVYDLAGAVTQFLPSGRVNNVDVRSGVRATGLAGDLAAASNRTDNTVTFYSVAPDGTVAEIGRLPVQRIEPYGFCLGVVDGAAHAFVTYKTGEVQRFIVSGFAGSTVTATEGAGWKFDTQLEGCAVDEANGVIFIGEEARGVWRAPIGGGEPVLIDAVGGPNGLTADVEGIEVWEGAGGAGYVVVSSQGSSAFHVYDRQPPHAFRGRFGIAFGPDVVTGTDGLDVVSTPLGPNLPGGLLVVQDDVNSDPAAPQNFKLVDWRNVAAALGLQAAR
jgi:3-phytase